MKVCGSERSSNTYCLNNVLHMEKKNTIHCGTIAVFVLAGMKNYHWTFFLNELDTKYRVYQLTCL